MKKIKKNKNNLSIFFYLFVSLIISGPFFLYMINKCQYLENCILKEDIISSFFTSNYFILSICLFFIVVYLLYSYYND